MSGDDIGIVRRMCEGGNGVFHDACLAVCDEIERLRAEVERLRAEREDIDLLHVPCTDDDLTFCHECVGGWPCRTHLRLHPEEARRG